MPRIENEALPDAIRWFHGLFVGQLNDEEIKLFERAISLGLCRRVYKGTSGVLGLAKIEVFAQAHQPPATS